VVRDAARAAGAPFLAVARRMADAAGAAGGAPAPERWAGLFFDRMHPSETGAEAIADALAALLAEEGLLPSAGGAR
jgi:lysophospholipase L1-like esterase